MVITNNIKKYTCCKKIKIHSLLYRACARVLFFLAGATEPELLFGAVDSRRCNERDCWRIPPVCHKCNCTEYTLSGDINVLLIMEGVFWCVHGMLWKMIAHNNIRYVIHNIIKYGCYIRFVRTDPRWITSNTF